MAYTKKQLNELPKLVRKLIRATSEEVSDVDKLLALSGFKCLLVDNGLFHDLLKLETNDKAIQFSLETYKKK